jgi:hypothetical protein
MDKSATKILYEALQASLSAQVKVFSYDEDKEQLRAFIGRHLCVIQIDKPTGAR